MSLAGNPKGLVDKFALPFKFIGC